MINGDPKVKNEAYIKNSLMLDEAIPSFSPKCEQTPNALSSKKCCILFIKFKQYLLQIYNQCYHHKNLIIFL